MTDLTTATDTLRASPLGELLEADLPTRLAALEALCEAVSGGDIQDERDQHTGPELGEASVRVHRACARLTGKRYQWLAVEEADGRWATTVFHPRTYASHVAHSHGISYRHARDIVRLARQLRDEIPRFGAALRAGTIGPDHVHAIAATALTSPTRIAALDELVELEEAPATGDGDHAPGSGEAPGQDETPGKDEGEGEGEGEGGSGEHTATRSVSVETFLLTQARDMRPEKVRQLGKYFAHVADPDADDRGYSKAKEREHLELVRTLDGWHLSGFLTEENGRLVRTAIDAVMTPPAPDDHRTADQRRAQALADLAHLVLD
ncbi:MAG TPA: 13E12 repeat family protein, partial [Candidatus Ruania gallistercoris]|nr:13E12 repeat family protein [Candidatus Ruania gallistercoris]